MNADDQFRIFRQGLVDCIDERELRERLTRSVKTKKPLRIKYGADPSAPHLHLGHTVPLRKLAALQDLGHHIIFLIGDFTARIGDPSLQTQARPELSRSEITRNAKTYQKQVFRILDKKKTEVVYNADWLGAFKPEDFLGLMRQYTVARILERDDFSKRYKDQKPITLLEFMYPLLQGYDSVHLKADIELGGTDQKFNFLVGRELQRQHGQAPQVVLTLPIIEGTDGKRKMSKSFGNAIALDDTAENMYGAVMSIPDTLLGRYGRYLTDLTESDITKLEEGLRSGALHPRKEKANLARRLVAIYHGEDKAQSAEAAFDRVFASGKLPAEIADVTLKERSMDAVTLLAKAGLVQSRGEARRLIRQGAVEIDEVRLTKPEENVSLETPRVIRCGKRRFIRVRCGV